MLRGEPYRQFLKIKFALQLAAAVAGSGLGAKQL